MVLERETKERVKETDVERCTTPLGVPSSEVFDTLWGLLHLFNVCTRTFLRPHHREGGARGGCRLPVYRFLVPFDNRPRTRFNAGPPVEPRRFAGQPQDVPLLLRPREDQHYPGRLPPEVPGVGSGEQWLNSRLVRRAFFKYEWQRRMASDMMGRGFDGPSAGVGDCFRGGVMIAYSLLSNFGLRASERVGGERSEELTRMF